MVNALNGGLLPAEYFAEFQVHVGSRIQVDVATFEQEEHATRAGSDGTATALAVQAYAPPTPTVVMPAVFPDDIEVQIFSTEAGPTLVGAVELISPGNKDREEARRAFAAKCAAYLQRGIGLVIVDVVTNRQANLHNELVRLMGQADQFGFPTAPSLYAAAYHPLRQSGAEQIDTWLAALAVAEKLPVMPLWLRGSICVPLDLEETYTKAREHSRLA